MRVYKTIDQIIEYLYNHKQDTGSKTTRFLKMFIFFVTDKMF